MIPTLRRSGLLPALGCILLATDLDAQRRGRSDIKRGIWNQTDKVPDGWVKLQTRHYQIQSEAGREKAERLAKHMEAMYLVYARRFPAGKPFTKRYPIKLLKNRGSFMAYGAPPGAGAYFSPVDKEMVCYDTGKWQDEEREKGPTTGEEKELTPLEKMRLEQARYKMDILGAAAHEGWHQYFFWYVGSWVEIPSWANEGLGDYFYTAMPKKTKGRRIPAELGRLNPTRLPVVQWAVKNNEHVPIKKLLKYSKSQYYSNPSICYAQGWALCQFMLHGGNRRYKFALEKFIKYVRDDTNMPSITEKAFRGIDLDKLEEDWKKWVLKAKLPK